MEKWLKQKTTITGLITLVMTGIQLHQSGGDWATVALGILSAALLWVKSEGAAEKLFIAGLFIVAASQQGCASIPIPKDAQIAAATSVGCAVIEEAGCYDELRAALPGLNETSCVEIVNQALTIAEQAKNTWKNDRSEYSEQLNKILATIPDGTIVETVN